MSEHELSRLAIDIAPDGQNLPPGGGSVTEGEALYRARCAGCHGVAGAGKPADRLTGGVGSLATPQPVKTIASYWPRPALLFDYLRRAMPLNAPRSLSDDETYALCAYLLSIDGLLSAELMADRGGYLDAARLRAVRMPNQEGFRDRSAIR